MTDVSLRKIRKKLRAIETLERLQRPLNQDETLQVSQKKNLRKRVSEILRIETNVNSTFTDENEMLKRTSEDSSLGENAGIDLQRKRLKSDEPSSSVPLLSNAITTDGSWRNKYFKVLTLKGHNDLINAVAIDGSHLVSASRDTTLKVWDTGTGTETLNLGGHTAPVTCLVLLTANESKELSRYIGLPGDVHRLVFSGSSDCSVNMWSISTGKMLKTWYTFNTINCMAYMACEVCVVTGTDGGKIEVWDAVSGGSLFSLSTFNDTLTTMKSKGFHLFTSTSDGMVNVWELENRKLKPLFSIDHLDPNSEIDLHLRNILCLDVAGDWIHYGDDGVNVKAINWKTGEVQKYRNHACQSGVTDAIVCVPSDAVISSSYDMDLGKGHLNVFSDNGDSYEGSLEDGRTGRIYCVGYTRATSGGHCIVSGGTELKLWQQLPESSNREVITDDSSVRIVIHPQYAAGRRDSSCESSASESDAGNQAADRFEKYYIPTVITADNDNSIWSWCCIL